MLILVAMAIMTFVSVSNFLEDSGITRSVDQYEDLAEILVFPLVGYALYAFNMSSQFAQLRTATNAARAEHAMLMNIVETSPVGIVVVDDIGYATFANQFAWDMLELQECDGTACCSSRGVVVPAGAAVPQERTMFDTSLLSRKVAQEAWEYVTPDGRIALLLSSTPLRDESGKLQGSVVVFNPLTVQAPVQSPA